MHHRQRATKHKFNDEIAIGNGINGIFCDRADRTNRASCASRTGCTNRVKS